MMTEEQKRSMAASLDAAYPRLVAQFASDPSHSRLWPGAAKVAVAAKLAVEQGRMTRIAASLEISQAWLADHQAWRDANPAIAKAMDRASAEDAKRAAARPKASRAPSYDPSAAVRRIESTGSRPASPARRADAGPALATPPPPAVHKLAASHAARAQQLGATVGAYLSHHGPSALEAPSSALTAAALAHCQARGLDPSIFASTAWRTPADRRRYLTPDWH